MDNTIPIQDWSDNLQHSSGQIMQNYQLFEHKSLMICFKYTPTFHSLTPIWIPPLSFQTSLSLCFFFKPALHSFVPFFVSWSQPGGSIFCQKPTGCGLLLFPYENITFSIETLDIPLNYSNSHHKHKEMWLCGSPMQSLEKKSTIHWIFNGINLILIWYFAMFHVFIPTTQK